MTSANRNGSRIESATATVRQSWYTSHIWLAPLITSLLLLFVITITLHETQVLDQRVNTRASIELSALANKYAERARLLISLADQLLLTVKWEIEQHPGTVNLAQMASSIVLPILSDMRITLADSRGILYQSTSSLMVAKDHIDISKRPFFKILVQTPNTGLVVFKAGTSKVTGQPALLLARRINNPDGSFGGLVIIGADVEEFLILPDSGALPLGTLVGLLGADGTSYAFRSTAAELTALMKKPPTDWMVRDSGELDLEAGPGEPHSRTVWKKIPGYALTTIVIQTMTGYVAMHPQATNKPYKVGLAFSLLILMAGGGWFAVAYRARARHLKQTSLIEVNQKAAEDSNDAFIVQKPVYDLANKIIDFTITDCNRRAELMYGQGPGQLIGVTLSQLAPGEQLFDLYLQTMKSGVPYLMTDVEVTPDSMMRARWITRQLVPFREGIAATIKNITASKEQARALTDMAYTDELTGLPNRRWLTENLPQAIGRCSAKSAQIALLFIDLDNFKTVNDTLGHDAGDALLMETAIRVRSAIREQDVLCRLGGDEMTVTLESFSSIDEVTRICERIVARVSSPLVIEGTTRETVVGASIGVSVYPTDAQEADALIKCADFAMYDAKAAGKGTFRFYSVQLSS